MDPLTAAVIILAIAVVLLFSAGAGLYRRVRQLELTSYHGVGLMLGDNREAPARLGVLVGDGASTVVVKVSRLCSMCEQVLQVVADRASSLPPHVRLVVLADSPDLPVRLPHDVPLVTDEVILRLVTLPYVPAGLLLDETGRVALTVPLGSPTSVDDLLERAAQLQAKEVPL